MDYKGMIGKTFEVTVDRPLGSKHHKFKNLFYPINYGYIEGVKAGDGDDVDVFIIDLNKSVELVKVKIIAIIHRMNDNEDKLVGIVNDREYTNDEIEAAVYFQEKYFKHKLIK